MRQGLSSATLDRVAQRAPQGELSLGTGGYRACSPLESDVLASLFSRADRTNSEALLSGLASYTSSWMREIRATMVADGTVPNVASVMDALSTAFGVAADNVTRSVCSNESLIRTLPSIQLSENLLATRPGALS
jgi:hypothetical protein